MKICDVVMVCKDAGVTRGLPSPHRLEDLTVDEVSLVTEPAILTTEESKAHKGFIVAKLGDDNDRVPEVIRKAVDTLDGEDLGTAVQRLAMACKKRLLADTGDSDTYYMSALKVFKDRVMMGFWWEDDAASLASSGRVAYYNCYYTQDSVTKEFTVTRSAGLVVSMQETAAPQAKNLEVAPEVVAEAPTEPPPEVPSVEAAPEAVPETAPEAAPETAPETPAVEAAPEVTPEAVVETSPETPVSEVTPEVAPEPTTKVADVLASLVAIGKSFEVDVSIDGKTTVRVVEKSAPQVSPPVTEQTEIAQMRTELEKALKGQDELRKKLAKTISEDPPTGQEIGVQRDAQPPQQQQLNPFGQLVAAGIAQTRMEP